MRDVIQHFIQRKSSSVMQEGLRKREEGEQRRRNVPVDTERCGGILANLVERRWIEGTDRPQLPRDLSGHGVEVCGPRRRSKPDPGCSPLSAAVALLAVCRGEQCA